MLLTAVMGIAPVLLSPSFFLFGSFYGTRVAGSRCDI